MKAELQKTVIECSKKATDERSATSAMQFSQAALNAVQALAVLTEVERNSVRADQ